MNRFKFEISVNGFFLKSHFNTTENSGIEHCRKFMTKFQKQVANLTMKVVISEREKKEKVWMYHKAPYLYKKTLIRKPLVKKSDADRNDNDPH